MQALAYGSPDIFLNETVIRAIEVLGRLGLGFMSSPKQADALLSIEANKGFHGIHDVRTLLDEYASNRSKWPDLASFGPELRSRLAARAGEIIQEYAPRESLHLDFEGPNGGLDNGLLSITHSIDSDTGVVPSEVLFDHGPTSPNAATPTTFLTLRADSTTRNWWGVSAKLAVKAGKVKASYRVRTKNIRQEGNQWPNQAWIGFFPQDLDGMPVKIDGQTRRYVGDAGNTNEWKQEEVEMVVDPTKVKSLQFTIAMALSGEVSVDDVDVQWE